MKRFLPFLAVILLSMAVFPHQALALINNLENRIENRNVATKEGLLMGVKPPLSVKSPLGTLSAQKKEVKKIRLEKSKLTLCLVKANVIRVRSRDMVRRVNRQIEVFDKIASRTATFYTDKVVSNGKTLSNYDELTSNIDVNRETIRYLLAEAKISAEDFNCDSNGPAYQLNQFKEQMQSIIDTFKEYKISVKNLIGAVTNLMEETASSPTVTATP